jgi:hypothetical protein
MDGDDCKPLMKIRSSFDDDDDIEVPSEIRRDSGGDSSRQVSLVGSRRCKSWAPKIGVGFLFLAAVFFFAPAITRNSSTMKANVAKAVGFAKADKHEEKTKDDKEESEHDGQEPDDDEDNSDSGKSDATTKSTSKSHNKTNYTAFCHETLLNMTHKVDLSRNAHAVLAKMPNTTEKDHKAIADKRKSLEKGVTVEDIPAVCYEETWCKINSVVFEEAKGDLKDINRSAKYLCFGNNNVLTGMVDDLPKKATHVDFQKNDKITGSLFFLPRNATYVDFQRTTLLRGVLQSIPRHAVRVDLRHSRHIKGDLKDLPPKAAFVDLAYNTWISGKLSDLPNKSITHLDLASNKHIKGKFSDFVGHSDKHGVNLTNVSVVINLCHHWYYSKTIQEHREHEIDCKLKEPGSDRKESPGGWVTHKETWKDISVR